MDNTSTMSNFKESLWSLVPTKISQWRYYKGWTQEMLAAQSGLSTRYIGDVERRSRGMTIRTLDWFLRAYDVDPITFFQGPKGASEETVGEQIKDSK